MKLNYKSLGQGHPIIILHGLFGMLDNWLSFGKMLEDSGFMVFLVDQRNHGRSPHSEEVSYSLMADDLRQFMEDHWIHRAVIIGHSMGGKTAMQFAHDFPNMVESLVVVDIAPKTYEAGHESVFAALRSIDLDKVTNRQEVEKALLNQLNEDQSTVQFLLKSLSRVKGEDRYQWKMNLAALYENYQQILDAPALNHEVDVPTLFIRGSESSYIQDEEVSLLHEAFPHSELITIESAGHWVHADKPDELFDSILSFIR